MSFTLDEVQTIAQAVGLTKWHEGYLAGMEAAADDYAAQWAEQAADAAEVAAHAAAVDVLHDMAGSPVAESWRRLGIDPVTASPDELRQAAAFLRYSNQQRVRAHLGLNREAAA